MSRRFLFFAIAFSFSQYVVAQTLFSYGKESVSAKDFLRAYNKNNADPQVKQSMEAYLDLYIASRLKIREAKSRGYDTLPQLVADLDNLRNQVVPNYMNDAAGLQRLVDEAFIRSQKDIHLAHIFISNNQNGLTDTAIALDKARAAMTKLQKGELFSNVAKEFSDDPSVKENGGDVGFVTVFTLPYELENLAYKTPVGTVSSIYHSKAGYHIFKNVEERKALGRIKASQILLAFPPGADDALRADITKLADSIYNVVAQGGDFATLATKYSNDVISANASGLMPEFGVGQFDPVFERTVYALKEGELSKPFLTTHGYHIVKMGEHIAVNTDRNNAHALQVLKEQVQANERTKTIQQELVQKILKKGLYKKESFNNAELYAYTDSLLDNRKPAIPVHINRSSALYKLGDHLIHTQDWITYAQTYRYKQDGTGLKKPADLWDEFVMNTVLDFYKKHLEDYNEEFRHQMDEFKDGNLFFEIMQREVWGPAQSDSIALEKFFTEHKQQYRWKESAEAVLFYVNDPSLAQKIREEIKANPTSWKAIVTENSEKLAADSGRFEFAQIPNNSRLDIRPGVLTEPVINKTDNSAAFAMVLKTHPAGEARNFSDAKGLVINDYQAQLEKKWVANLRKKYPVVINQKVLAGLKGNKNVK